MRKDEEGNPCPSTLGEYRDLCEAMGLTNNAAVAFLDKKIKENSKGRDAEVIAADFQVRFLLMPMLIQGAK